MITNGKRSSKQEIFNQGVLAAEKKIKGEDLTIEEKAYLDSFIKELNIDPNIEPKSNARWYKGFRAFKKKYYNRQQLSQEESDSLYYLYRAFGIYFIISLFTAPIITSNSNNSRR